METAKFNNRLQVIQLGLGNSAMDTSLWKVDYKFGELNSNGTVDANKNTGNIAKQTVSFSGLSQPFVQEYKYDALYRLTEAKETANSVQNWKQEFGYDRYGNRTSYNKFLGTSAQTLTAKEKPTIQASNNRFNSGQGYSYDKAGNILSNFEGWQFTFNGDNKQTEVKDSAGNVIGTYFYNGDGMRIKKVTNSETVVFVYSGGKKIAEYSTDLAPSVSTKYLTEDHLGTPRVISDQSGAVLSRRDMMPFGEDLKDGVGARNNALKYGIDDKVREGFTGYEKDKETGLDFAEARMYENRHGRFTAVDPLLASGNGANPQTFNRYVYVGNDPINITDPLGLDWYTDNKSVQFKWFDDNPGDGYSAVSFGSNDTYSYTGCVLGDCNFTATAYLNKGGGWNWDTSEYLSALDAWSGTSDTFVAMGKQTANEVIGVSNAFYWLAERADINYIATGRTPNIIHRTELFKPANANQATSMWSTSTALTGVTLASGGFMKSKPPSFSGVFNGADEALSIPTSSLNFTDKMRKGSLKRLANDIGNNGVHTPIDFVKIGGENFVVGGNHRTVLSRKFGFDAIPANRVSLPYKGFKTEQDVLMHHAQFGNPFGSSTYRNWNKYFNFNKGQ